jgi:hypothetical protein
MAPRKNDFILDISGPSVDIAPATIEELQSYVETRQRLAFVASKKSTYDLLERVSHQLAGNYKKPILKLLQVAKSPYIEVLQGLMQKTARAMIVIERDAMSEDISSMLCQSDYPAENDIDLMLCKEGFESITAAEMRKANLLRIHANPEFNPLIIDKLGEVWQQGALLIIIAQVFTNIQYDEVNKYMESCRAKYGEENMKSHVDYDELARQLSYYVYVDVEYNKILNMPKEELFNTVAMLKAGGGFPPLDEEQTKAFVESISI